jgi:hypothetical protein
MNALHFSDGNQQLAHRLTRLDLGHVLWHELPHLTIAEQDIAMVRLQLQNSHHHLERSRPEEANLDKHESRTSSEKQATDWPADAVT